MLKRLSSKRNILFFVLYILFFGLIYLEPKIIYDWNNNANWKYNLLYHIYGDLSYPYHGIELFNIVVSICTVSLVYFSNFLYTHTKDDIPKVFVLAAMLLIVYVFVINHYVDGSFAFNNWEFGRYAGTPFIILMVMGLRFLFHHKKNK